MSLLGNFRYQYDPSLVAVEAELREELAAPEEPAAEERMEIFPERTPTTAPAAQPASTGLTFDGPRIVSQ